MKIQVRYFLMLYLLAASVIGVILYFVSPYGDNGKVVTVKVQGSKQ
jgi:hypothetical protein